MVDVVDNLRAAGVDQLGLLTEQIQAEAQAGSRGSAGRPVSQDLTDLLKEQLLWQWQLAAAGGPKADINMTPMIDVLLVLLIIFMVITPLTPKGLEALVPQPPPPEPAAEPVRSAHRGHRRSTKHKS